MNRRDMWRDMVLPAFNTMDSGCIINRRDETPSQDIKKIPVMCLRTEQPCWRGDKYFLPVQILCWLLHRFYKQLLWLYIVESICQRPLSVLSRTMLLPHLSPGKHIFQLAIIAQQKLYTLNKSVNISSHP